MTLLYGGFSPNRSSDQDFLLAKKPTLVQVEPSLKISAQLIGSFSRLDLNKQTNKETDR